MVKRMCRERSNDPSYLEACGSLLEAFLNLLIAAGLTDLEILHDEIAALVELCVVIGEFLQLEEGDRKSVV